MCCLLSTVSLPDLFHDLHATVQSPCVNCAITYGCFVVVLESSLFNMRLHFPTAAPPKQVPVGTQFYEDIVIDENSTTQDERSLSVFFFIWTDKQWLTRALSSSGSLESGCSRLSGFFQISLLFKSLRQMLTSLVCFIEWKRTRNKVHKFCSEWPL